MEGYRDNNHAQKLVVGLGIYFFSYIWIGIVCLFENVLWNAVATLVKTRPRDYVIFPSITLFSKSSVSKKTPSKWLRIVGIFNKLESTYQIYNYETEMIKLNTGSVFNFTFYMSLFCSLNLIRKIYKDGVQW